MARKPKYGENQETKDVMVTLPKGAIAGLDAMANRMLMSRSELIARIGLGEIPLKLTELESGKF
jgi:hypothetical protein